MLLRFVALVGAGNALASACRPPHHDLWLVWDAVMITLAAGLVGVAFRPKERA